MGRLWRVAGVLPAWLEVAWEALEDAFENNAPEVHSYLHLSTGEVLRVVDGIADPEMHQRIASDTSYMRVEPVSSREQYRWMERFIPMVEDKPLSDLLVQAIDGKVSGVSARFVHLVAAGHAPSPVERERLAALLTYGDPYRASIEGALIIVAPRFGTVSPWASKATDIAHNCGIALRRGGRHRGRGFDTICGHRCGRVPFG